VLVSPLGTLGDRLVWARWRPFCVLLALSIFCLGAPWWAAVGAFLVLYNAAHIALRVWGWRLGWREGQSVGRALLGSPLRRVPERLTIPLAGIGGAVLPLVAVELGRSAGLDALPVLGIALFSTAIGLWRPVTTGRMTVAGLVIISLALVTAGMIGR
jgi:PTS system mannose-specific IID component